jgi:hypothetical protein
VIEWRFWLAVAFTLFVMTVASVVASVVAMADPRHRGRNDADTPTYYGFAPSTFEEHWGRDVPDVLQFYYRHDHAHGDWFNRKKNCCGGKDCLPARSGTVKWTPDGYRVIMPDGGYAIVPEEDSPTIPEDVTETRATVCLWRSSFTKGPFAYQNKVYYNTKYRIRSECFWSGKTRI